MKIYTKSGDKGETSLFSGERVAKDHPRIVVYGTLDEVISFLGLAMSSLPFEESTLRKISQGLQHDLMHLSSLLATQSFNKPYTEKILSLFPEEKLQALEAQIDEWTAALPPLKKFILPGGHPFAAAMHLARTKARCAERLLLPLKDDTSLPQHVFPYINRLSDALFTLARYGNYLLKVQEVEH